MKSFISRRDRIILSAIDIINELGIQGLSTKEIAARQEVNESALYRHFKNKDAIIDGVLEYFSQFDEAIFNTILKKEMNFKEKIMAYMGAYLEYYEGYPAITSIALLYESLNRESSARIKMGMILEKRNNSLTSLIEEGQANGEINKIFTPNELVLMIFGLCDKVIFQWRLEGCSYSFKDSTISTLDKLLSVIFCKDQF